METQLVCLCLTRDGDNPKCPVHMTPEWPDIGTDGSLFRRIFDPFVKLFRQVPAGQALAVPTLFVDDAVPPPKRYY